MIQNLPIRSKQIAILVLPVVALLVLGALRVSATVSEGLAAQRVHEASKVAASLAGLVQELQRERDLSAGYVAAGKLPGREQVLEQRPKVDQALGTFRGELGRLDLESFSRRMQTLVVNANQRLSNLDRQRRSIDSDAPLTLVDSLGYYTDTIDNLLEVVAEIPDETNDRRLGRDLSTLVSLALAKESVAMQRGFLYGVLSAGRFRLGEAQRFAALIGSEETWLSQFRASATDAQQDYFRDTVIGPDIQRVNNLRARALGEGDALEVGVDPALWWSVSTAKVDLLRTVERRLADDVLVTSADGAVAARRQALVDGGLTALVLLLSIGLSLLIARSMVRSLQRLREAANDIAERRLPGVVDKLGRLRYGERADLRSETAPIAVRSKDEIGQVAEAFNSVHQVAVRVATEQAGLRKSVGDMFLNLARRNQALIDRQLELIDELERNEIDPDALQELFRLDHLATRMRRNAEDLIVLSGAKPARRWSQPVALADAVRAALAEVEDYTRVELLPIHDVSVAGQAVGDVVHLLAELIENATAFSPPGTKVHVAGQPVGGGYVIEIEDRGIGMSDAELVEANQRLARPPTIDLTLSQRLGLFVVGRLAQRYGIKVQLRHSWYDGVTALVLLPDSLLVHPGAEGQPPAANGRGRPRATGTHAEAAQPSAGQQTPEVHLPIFEAARADWFDTGGARIYVPVGRPGQRADAVTVPAARALSPRLTRQGPKQAPPPPAPAEPQPPAAQAQLTKVGLPRRVPRANLAPGMAQRPPPAGPPAGLDPEAQRSPDQVRSTLSSYRSGFERGRTEASGTTEGGEAPRPPRSDDDATQ